MNFIYDIVLNFSKDYYDFFEWNKKDNIMSIKKIPLFLVDSKIFKMMKYDKVTVKNEFIDSIKGKTFTYSRVKMGPSCLISNGREVIGVLFNDDGTLVKRSSLLLDEEEEVLDEIVNAEETSIEIVKYQKGKVNDISRIKREKKDFLIKYINKEKNDINLRYLYYDYFEKENDDITSIKDLLIKEIRGNWNKKLDNFYETVKIFNKIKN